jgi:hypothetical protein
MTVIVDGTISANGGRGNQYQGGGSGGSIWIEAAAVSGAGLIQANGGQGGSGSIGQAGGYSGSGGRIAIYGPLDNFGGQLQAFDGGSGGPIGGPGTIYLDDGSGIGLLLVDNNNRNGSAAFLPAGDHLLAEIQLSRYGHLEVAGDLVTSLITGDQTAVLTALTGIQPDNQTLLLNGVTLLLHGPLGPVDLLTIEGGGRLHLAAQDYSLGQLTLTTLHVNEGTLTLAGHDEGDNEGYGFILYAQDVVVGANGRIEANGLGYDLNSGPGSHADGASHGGVGGGNQPTYGSPYTPVTLGSGGSAGRGGGAVRLLVDDTLRLDGQLQVNGLAGGSGGSLWIETTTITGTTGLIQANGGSQAGGGGRIALYAQANHYQGAYEAGFGGGTCPAANCDGTIYLDTAVPYSAALNANPLTLPADGTTSTTITATLSGLSLTLPATVELRFWPEEGVLLNGQPVQGYIPLGLTNEDGVVTATVTTTAAGVKSISARTTAGDVIDRPLSLTFTPGAVDNALSTLVSDRTELFADGQDGAVITATLRDAWGNPLPGEGVHFETTGTHVNVTLPVSLTNAAGQVQAIIDSTQVQTITVAAAIQPGGPVLQQTATLVFVTPPPAAGHSAVDITPQTALADGSQTIVITATLRDILGRLLPERLVELIVSGSGHQVTPDPVTGTDTTGTAVFNLSSTNVETKDLTLHDLTSGQWLALGQATFVAGDPDLALSTLTIDQNTITADGSSSALVAATLYDSSGHPLPDRQLLIQADGQNLLLAQPHATTDAQGTVYATIRSQTVQTVTVTAVDTASGLTVAQSATLTIIAGPPVSEQSEITITPTTALATAASPLR